MTRSRNRRDRIVALVVFRIIGDNRALRRLTDRVLKVAEMLRIEIDREEDGRWIGEVPELPGVFAYGASRDEAKVKVTALAFRVIADRIENGEPVPINTRDIFVGA